MNVQLWKIVWEVVQGYLILWNLHAVEAKESLAVVRVEQELIKYLLFNHFASKKLFWVSLIYILGEAGCGVEVRLDDVDITSSLDSRVI